MLRLMSRTLGLAVLVALVAVSVAAPAFAQQYTLKVGHVLAPTEPIHEAALWWADEVERRTDGRVKLEIYPSSQLGSNLDTYEQAKFGAPIIGHADPAYLGDLVPDFAILNGPYLFQEWDDIAKLTESDWFAELNAQLIKQEGLRVLSFNWVFGQRHTISRRPLRNPEEMRGAQFRVPPNTMWRETILAMGASPTPLEWAEVYSGLAQGVVDAAEAPLSTLYGSKLHEVATHVTLTGHFRAITGMVIGEAYWQLLPPDLQEILLETAVEAGEVATEKVLAAEAEWIEIMRAEGVTFHEADVDAFTEATTVVYTKFPRWTPGLFDAVQTLMGR